MKKTVFLLFAALFLGANGWAVPADEVASLRQHLAGSRQAVTEADRGVIDRFWRIALDAMLLSEDPAQLVSIRIQLQQEKGTEPLNPYATAYDQTAKTHLNSAFEAVSRWANSERKSLMERNLMILTAQLESVLLADIGLERLEHADVVVRYWAAKAVANAGVARQLPSADTATADAILNAVAARVAAETSSEILRVIVTFAGMVDHDQAREILMAAAQRRIEIYRSWRVENESLDTVLLKVMGQLVIAEQNTTRRAAMAQRFAELFSMVFQRYLADPSPLTDTQKQALLNVIVEVDNQILSRMLGQQTAILRAIQRPTGGLDREYEAIFGSDVGAGLLAIRLGFDYGKTPQGRAIHTPPKLPPPSRP